MHGRKGLYKGAGCREQFTVTVGTIRADTRIPLNKWLLAFHLLRASKKGMSAHHLTVCSGSPQERLVYGALYSLRDDSQPLSSKLDRIAEINEACVAGRRRHKKQSRRIGTAHGRMGRFKDISPKKAGWAKGIGLLTARRV